MCEVRSKDPPPAAADKDFESALKPLSFYP
jgi:hypothetical protein